MEWDTQALLWINSHRHLVLDVILGTVAYAGELAWVWIVVCLGLVIGGNRDQKKLGLLVIIAMVLIDRCIAKQLGYLFFRERPYLALEGIQQAGITWETSSFPSGHAHSVWLATILLGKQWRNLLFPMILFALFTCYSRPYWGMHYPLDVIAGSILGITAGLTILGIQKLRTRPRQT